MSALAKQLADIAAKSTHQLDIKAQRTAHAKSLLFEPKIAISQDFETLYQIGYEALEELVSLDNRFLIYANNLFSEQSRYQDRGQLTVAQNEDLDVVIQSFMGLVSAKLLLKPAQKAVEWLIRRFRIHAMNTQDLLLAFLPYHSTPMFLQVMSLLQTNYIPASFRFIIPYHASAKNPPLHTVLYTAAHNPSFFAAFNHHMLRIAKAGAHSSTIISFWSCITSQAIDTMLTEAQSGINSVQNERLEDILLNVLPIINDALALASIPEVTICACMFITVLSSKGRLPGNVTSSLIETIISTWSSETIDARIICLSTLIQAGQIKRLSKSAFKRLMTTLELVDRLNVISQAFQIETLLLKLISRSMERFIRKGDKKSLEFVKEVILTSENQPNLRQSFVKQLITEATSFLAIEGEFSVQERNDSIYILKSLFELIPLSQLSSILQSQAQLKGLDLNHLGITLQMTFTRHEENRDIDEIEDETKQMNAHHTSHLNIKPMFPIIASPALFLECFRSANYNELENLFSLVSSNRQDLEEFLNQFQFNDKAYSDDDNPSLMSFLIRFACSKQPAKQRLTALDSITELITKTSKGNSDFQLLLPYIVHCLSDSRQIIRRASSRCLTAISKPFEGNSLPKTWARSTFYIDSKNSPIALSCADVKVLLSNVLLPRIEEFILDPQTISKNIISILSKSQKTSDMGISITSNTRAALIQFFAAHASKTKLLAVRSTIFNLVAFSGKHGQEALVQFIYPEVNGWNSLDLREAEESCHFQGVGLNEANISHIDTICARDAKGIHTLMTFTMSHNTRQDVVTACHARLQALWKDIDENTRNSVLSQLYTVATSRNEESKDQNDERQAERCLRSLPLHTNDLNYLLSKLPKAVKMPDAPGSKRRRISKTQLKKFEVAPSEVLGRLYIYTMILEVIDQSNPSSHPGILSQLFEILIELQSFAIQTDASLEYLKFIAINSLLQIVDALETKSGERIDTSSIQIDSLVEIIRETNNSQLQNATLLLVSSLAKWVPDAVLHSIMPIFTFMGNSILRQGDGYSALVINQTVSKVLPPVVASLRKNSKDIISGVSNLLLSFTAAFEHIPLHRRLVLFQSVVNALGPEECLFAVIIMIIDRLPTDSSTNKFVIDLLGLYDMNTQLIALQQCVDLILEMFSTRRTRAESLVNLKDKTTEQIHAKAGSMIQTLAELFSRQELKTRVVNSLQNVQTAADQQENFSNLMNSSIKLTQHLINSPCYNYSRALFSNSLGLLPVTDLVESAKMLLNSKNIDIREVVITAIGEESLTVSQKDQSAIIALLDFMNKLSESLPSSHTESQIISTIKCLNHISTRFGKKSSSKVLTAAKATIEHGLFSSESSTQIIALKTLTSMINILREELVPLVPKLLKQCYKVFSVLLQSGVTNIQLQSSCVILISTMTQHISFVMSGDNLDTAIELVQLSTIKSEGLIHQTQTEFYEKLSRYVESSELFSAISRNFKFDSSEERGVDTISYLQFAKMAIEAKPKAEVVKNASKFFEFLLKAFELRVQSKLMNLDSDTTYDLELIFIDLFISMILKINDTTLRPFFIKLVELVTSFEENRVYKTLRFITFFRLFKAIIHRLKALVTGYSAYVLDLINELLTHAPESSDEVFLLQTVLDGVSESFEYDQDEFWQSPHHFSMVAEPLLSQLEIQIDGITENHAIPAITMFAAAVSSPDRFKDINVVILKYMRADSVSTRLAAVKCQRSLTEKLGEDWLVQLPEMLPVIVELLEDDNEKVEKETRVWIRSVEEILGESLDSMLQ